MSDGIRVAEGATAVVITNCECHSNGRDGVHIPPNSSVVCENVSTANNIRDGIHIGSEKEQVLDCLKSAGCNPADLAIVLHELKNLEESDRHSWLRNWPVLESIRKAGLDVSAFVANVLKIAQSFE